MKKCLSFLFASFLALAGFAQKGPGDKYIKAMEAKVPMIDSNNSTDGWKELANSFERIADAEKTQWLPYYYASYCTIMAGYNSLPQDGSFGDNSSIVDPLADKAESLLNKATELSKENAEIYCAWKMVHSFRMMGNAMARYMTIPRIYILEGQDKFYTPEEFGGSKTEAKQLFEKARDLFAGFKPESSIAPDWGRKTVAYFLDQLK
jgi:hypothetical protein